VRKPSEFRLGSRRPVTFRVPVETPGAGATREYFTPEFQGLRMWSFRGLDKHLLFYREIGEGLEIVRVIYGAS